MGCPRKPVNDMKRERARVLLRQGLSIPIIRQRLNVGKTFVDRVKAEMQEQSANSRPPHFPAT